VQGKLFSGQFPGCRSSFRRMFPLASWLGNLCFISRNALETLDSQVQASLPSGAFSGRKLPSSESCVSLLQNAAGRCREEYLLNLDLPGCAFSITRKTPPRGKLPMGSFPQGNSVQGKLFSGQFPGCRSSFRRMFPLASWLGNLCFIRRNALETLDSQVQASLPSGAFSGRKLPSSESCVSLLHNAAGRCREEHVLNLDLQGVLFPLPGKSPPGKTSHGQLPAVEIFAGKTGQFPGCRSSFRRMFPLASWLGNLCFIRRNAFDFQMQASLLSGAFSGRKLPSSESCVSLLQNAAGRCRDDVEASVGGLRLTQFAVARGCLPPASCRPPRAASRHGDSPQDTIFMLFFG
jgi:hypothetical protein